MQKEEQEEGCGRSILAIPLCPFSRPAISVNAGLDLPGVQPLNMIMTEIRAILKTLKI